MGEEIEKHILKKLDDAIKESQDSKDFPFAAKFFVPKFHRDFIELRDLIKTKIKKIKESTTTTTPSNVRDPGATTTHHHPTIPASTSAAIAKKDSKLLLPAVDDEKDTGIPPSDVGDKKEYTGNEKESAASPDAEKESDASEKVSASDAGDRKETGAPSDAGDKNETGAPLDAGDKNETGAPSDAGDKNETGAAGEKKQIGSPLDAIAGDKKESTAPLDASNEKETGTPLAADGAEKESEAPLATISSKTTSPDYHELDPHTSEVGGGKKQDNVGTSAKTTSQVESEISPATDDAETGGKSTTPPASAGGGQKASKTPTFAKTSPDYSEISPVTDGGAKDHKSKTQTSAGGGKEESAISHADKSKQPSDLLREQLYYLNNVLTEWQMITKKPFSCSDSLSSMKDLSKTLKNIKQDLKPEPIKKKEESSHSRIPSTDSSDNASPIRTTPEVVEFRWSTPVILEKVHGFEDKILSLERLLVPRRKDTDAFKAFGIHGMAGVGKTTLCQSIFKRDKVTEHFFPRIWVCLSTQKDEDEDNKKEVVKRMLRCLGIDDMIIKKVDDKQSIRGLLFALRLQLTGKKYLIVLDDAHNPDKWFKMADSDAENDNNKIYEKFSYGLPKEHGGTVLVTSRVEQVVKNMVGEEENLRCIEPLTDKGTCWSIFTDTVKKDGIEFPEDLNKLELEIVKRCDGLPLAAKLLGQIKHKELKQLRTTEAGKQQAAVQAAK